MKLSHETRKNLPSGSMRNVPAQNVLSDTNEDEKLTTATINIEVLRVVCRILLSVRAKIESEGRVFK